MAERPIYVPIIDSFFESSIMDEDVATRFVFLGLIRLACRPRSDGVVDIPMASLARMLNLTPIQVQTAIEKLMSPDPESGNQVEEGRRIIPIDPNRPQRNWRLVNWAKYQEVVHRANDTARKREERARLLDKTDESEDVQEDPNPSEDVQKSPKVSVNGATIRDEKIGEGNLIPPIEVKKPRGRPKMVGPFVPPTLAEAQAEINENGYHFTAERFIAHYQANGWVQSKGKPIKDWRAAMVYWESNNYNKPNVLQPKKTFEGYHQGPLEPPPDEPTPADPAPPATSEVVPWWEPNQAKSGS